MFLVRMILEPCYNKNCNVDISRLYFRLCDIGKNLTHCIKLESNIKKISIILLRMLHTKTFSQMEHKESGVSKFSDWNLRTRI
jgi:hypothetical protein